MLTNNPMKDPKVAKKVSETNKAIFLADPNHPWHKNVERLRSWLHQHPSQSQKILFNRILDEIGVHYQPEHRIKMEQKVEGSKSYYIADAAIPESMIDIEVDGWWHYNSEQIAQSDRIRRQNTRAQWMESAANCGKLHVQSSTRGQGSYS